MRKYGARVMIKVREQTKLLLHKFLTNFLDGAKYQIEKMSHSIPQFRVNGPMQNMKEFAKDFHCPDGADMNPAKKCEIWG